MTATVMVFVGFLAFVKPFGSTPVGTTVGSRLTPVAKPRLRAEIDSSRIKSSKTEMPIIVRTQGEDDQEFPAQNLLDAMQTAIGAVDGSSCVIANPFV